MKLPPTGFAPEIDMAVQYLLLHSIHTEIDRCVRNYTSMNPSEDISPGDPRTSIHSRAPLAYKHGSTKSAVRTCQSLFRRLGALVWWYLRSVIIHCHRVRSQHHTHLINSLLTLTLTLTPMGLEPWKPKFVSKPADRKPRHRLINSLLNGMP